MRSSSGYSLIEILVVLAVVSLLAGLASVRWIDLLSHYRLNHAVRTLVSDLRWARQLAITEGQPVRLILDLDREQYQIERASEPEVPVNGIRDFQDRQQGFGDIDIVRSSGGGQITFQSNGITTDWTTITLQNMKGEERRVTLIVTGRVKVL